MKITNKDVQALFMNKPAIFVNRDLPVKTMYWLARLEKKLIDVLTDFNEERNKFIMDFCKKDDKGFPVINKTTNQFEYESKDDLDKVTGKIIELMNLEIDIPFEKIRINLEDITKWNEEAEKKGKEKVINPDEIAVLLQFVDFKDGEVR